MNNVTKSPVSNDNKSQGPKFFLDIEGEQISWNKDTITTEELIQLGGWDQSIGATIIDQKTNEERTLQSREVIEIKPGMGFSKKLSFKRG